MDNGQLSKMAQFIAKLRKEKGLTQKNLAEQLDVTDKAVSKWERGLSLPDISLLGPLAEILGVSASELLNGERVAAPMPEMEAAVTTTLQYADKSTQKVKANNKWWKSIALAATAILISVLVLLISQRAIENGSGLMIFPSRLTGFICLLALATAFALGKNKIASVLLCGFLVAVTTYVYSILNQDSLNNPVISPAPTEFRTSFIPHYAVILMLLILSLAVLVTSIMIQKKAVSGDLVFLLSALGLTSLIIMQITFYAIMDYVDLNGLGVNPRYSVLMVPTFLMTLLSLALLARRQIRLKRQVS